MRFLAIFFLVALLLSAKEESLARINGKIKQARQDLKKHSITQKKIQNSISSLSRSIFAHEKRLKANDRLKDKTIEKIKILQKNSKENQKKLKEFRHIKSTTITSRADLENVLIDLMASNIATSMVIEKQDDTSVSDLIKREIFTKIKNDTNKKINSIKHKYINLGREIRTLSAKINTIEATINDLKVSLEDLERIKKDQKQTIASLGQKQKRYKKRLQDILIQKRRERKLLVDLDIIKNKTLKKIRSQNQKDKSRLSKLGRVKRYGSSYQAVRKKHYRGRKYKAPIDDKFAFKVTKRFGPYIDPIYKIKIHNDYIAMKTKQDAIVRSVMRGKVVFADRLQMLGNVVIVKHSNNMHTIYRNLKRISPNVKVNRKIKAREAVGRVHNELVFEVTKDGVPINPLELISVPKGAV